MNKTNSPQLLVNQETQEISIHDAMALAASESAQSNAMKPYSVRLPEGVKEAAQYICERNATDLGTFLRNCAVVLVKDYGLDPDQG